MSDRPAPVSDLVTSAETAQGYGQMGILRTPLVASENTQGGTHCGHDRFSGLPAKPEAPDRDAGESR